MVSPIPGPFPLQGDRLSARPALASVADDDLVGVVDVSDATMAATGTNKRMTVAVLADYVQSALDNLPPLVRARNFPVVDLKADYGAAGDGVTDDTTALADFFADVTDNNLEGIIPPGNYPTSATIVIENLRGWSIHGANKARGAGGARITCTTDNIPIIQLGNASSTNGLGISLRNFELTYTNVQDTSDTSANPIYFYGEVADGDIGDIDFIRGHYAMKVRASPGIIPYSMEMGPFQFGSEISGGVINATGALGAGSNNTWRRMQIACNTMAGPIFNNLRSWASTFDALEFTGALLGPQLFLAPSGFIGTFHGIKLEVASYTGAGLNLFDFQANHQVVIDTFSIGGTTGVFTPTSGTLACISHGSGGITSASWVRIGAMNLTATSLSGQSVAISGGSVLGRAEIGNIYLANGWTLSNVGSTTAAEFITVQNWKNDGLSANRGDAAYAVTLGDPNINHFTTAFTASRNIDLPLQTGNNLHTGLYYEFIFDGAVNGANTAVIRNNTTPILTVSVDKVRVRYTWRRSAWVLTKFEPVYSSLQTGYTTFGNLTTDRTLDANATTLDEVADVLGTLIEDLKARGVISA